MDDCKLCQDLKNKPCGERCVNGKCGVLKEYYSVRTPEGFGLVFDDVVIGKVKLSLTCEYSPGMMTTIAEQSYNDVVSFTDFLKCTTTTIPKNTKMSDAIDIMLQTFADYYEYNKLNANEEQIKNKKCVRLYRPYE